MNYKPNSQNYKIRKKIIQRSLYKSKKMDGIEHY